ncbi:hypothetical protein [Micromonospora sp. NPDC049374]|uniref:hypothetical protein n=1 Tax=Micromonospora sp. NPDC049374 TaxID=3154352 RepID=UPI00343DF94B
MTPTVPLAHDVDGVGPLLVAIHGMTEDRHFWNRVPLASYFRTVRSTCAATEARRGWHRTIR